MEFWQDVWINRSIKRKNKRYFLEIEVKEVVWSVQMELYGPSFLSHTLGVLNLSSGIPGNKIPQGIDDRPQTTDTLVVFLLFLFCLAINRLSFTPRSKD